MNSGVASKRRRLALSKSRARGFSTIDAQVCAHLPSSGQPRRRRTDLQTSSTDTSTIVPGSRAPPSRESRRHVLSTASAEVGRTLEKHTLKCPQPAGCGEDKRGRASRCSSLHLLKKEALPLTPSTQKLTSPFSSGVAKERSSIALWRKRKQVWELGGLFEIRRRFKAAAPRTG